MTLEAGESDRNILMITPDKGTEGQYVVLVTLKAGDSELDTQRLYVEVEQEGTMIPLFVALVVLAGAGLGGLGYFTYNQMKEQNLLK